MKHVTGLALLLAGLVGLSFLAQEAGAQEARQELYFSKPQALSKSENALLRGDAETARQLLARALERGIGQRHLYTAHNNLCVALFMLEEYEEAVANCQAAIKLRSNRWRAYNNLGNAFAKLGRLDDAIEAYEQGLRLAEGSEVLQKNLEAVQRRKRMRGPHSRRASERIPLS